MKVPVFLKLTMEKWKNVDIWGERNFRRDWRAVLIIGFVILAASLVFIWFANRSILDNLTKIEAGHRTVLTINRSEMDRIVNFYKNQKMLFEEAKSAKVSVPDPSK